MILEFLSEIVSHSYIDAEEHIRRDVKKIDPRSLPSALVPSEAIDQ